MALTKELAKSIIPPMTLVEAGPVSPEEVKVQGEAIIARVRSFFEGIDISKAGSYKNGMVDIEVWDFPFAGYRIARASVNGIRIAEIDTYDTQIGLHPYYKNHPNALMPVATYELIGKTGESELNASVFITEYPEGMKMTTELEHRREVLGPEYPRPFKAKHKYGVTSGLGWLPTNPESSYDPLERPVEIGVLRDLRVEF